MVGAQELYEFILIHFGSADLYLDSVCADGGDSACALGKHNNAGVNGSLVFHTGADYRIFGAEQRNRLFLHV